MKRYVQCSDPSNRLMTWFRGEEVDELMKDMKPREKQMIGKLANAKDIESYFYGMVDTLGNFGAQYSDAFDTFLMKFAEMI